MNPHTEEAKTLKSLKLLPENLNLSKYLPADSSHST